MNELNSANKAPKRKCIGNYMIEKTIGSGTFGKVKLGNHLPTRAHVAIKILEKQRIADASDIERVSREIHILKLVRHPHIIQLYEILETHKQLYLVMEYASGGELFDYIISKKQLEEAEACRFFRQIISGVEMMHFKGIAHRDLKPENLLLDSKQNIKIVDFGLSNTFQPGQALKTACGSPCYASPEMISGKRYDPESSDVWSTGVILFAMVCGYLPFEDTNTGALYRKIVAGDFHIPNSLSKPLRSLIKRMLSTDPATRITIAEIRLSEWYMGAMKEASLLTTSLHLTCGTASCGKCRCWTQTSSGTDFDEEVIAELSSFDFPSEYAIKCLQLNKHNHATTMYYLLLERKREDEQARKRNKLPNSKHEQPCVQSARLKCPVYSMATPLVQPATVRDQPTWQPRLDPLPFSRKPLDELSDRPPSFRKRSEQGLPSFRVALTSAAESNCRTRSTSPSFNLSFGRPSSARPPTSRLSVSPYLSSVASSLSRPTASTSAKMRPPATAPFGSTSKRLDLVTPPLRPSSARKPLSARPVLPFSSTRQVATPASARPVIQVKNGSNFLNVPISARIPIRQLVPQGNARKSVLAPCSINSSVKTGPLRRPLATISAKRNAFTIL